MNKRYTWDAGKNERLKKIRGVSFEEVYLIVELGREMDIVFSPDQTKYPGQRMYVVELKEYVWLVPFFETDREIILKTVIPSRKAAKLYRKEAKTDA
ncbi:MAG: toxin [Deltaproteobacteria bacterium]|nr:toxin [Deltaproteobacteria bacterium]